MGDLLIKITISLSIVVSLASLVLVIITIPENYRGATQTKPVVITQPIQSENFWLLIVPKQ